MCECVIISTELKRIISNKREVIKMIEKNFKFKGQMINYYNKVKANVKVNFVHCGYNYNKGCYEVCYSYKR